MYGSLLEGDGNRVMDYFPWFGYIELWKVDMEHAKLSTASRKDVVLRSLTSYESELALAGAAVASADLASLISQVKSKEGLKKCTACSKRVGLMVFSCKCGDLFCAVHHNSDKHNCPFDYRNAGQNAIAKANPIIVS
ncbi:Zinc finger A20 and AN1 domain-containing stress-associated protein 2 [Capsicum baccatum]|uniref:Zinc finger A20 and AN1 domain-containing stress-associated protein 2 n=1 Tax=Capsicum baccatum TaxID=33114 RepID=A0A2G2V8Z6_CAPBA|nr:Zinc finger A20 and AN1 domain-containing stress-associated protein 2 [Capsicum baccatum]